MCDDSHATNHEIARLGFLQRAENGFEAGEFHMKTFSIEAGQGKTKRLSYATSLTSNSNPPTMEAERL